MTSELPLAEQKGDHLQKIARLLDISEDQMNQEAELETLLQFLAHIDRTKEDTAWIQTLALSLIDTERTRIEDAKSQLSNYTDTLRFQLDTEQNRIADKIGKLESKIVDLQEEQHALEHRDMKARQMKGKPSETQIEIQSARLTKQINDAQRELDALSEQLEQSPQIINILRQIEQNEGEYNESLTAQEALDQSFLAQCQKLDQEQLYFETMQTLFRISAITHEQDFTTAVYEANETDEEILNLATSEVEELAADLMPLFTPKTQEELLTFAQKNALIRPAPEGGEEEGKKVRGDEEAYTPITVFEAAEKFIARVCGQGEGTSKMPQFLKIKSPVLQLAGQLTGCEEGQEEPLIKQIETYFNAVHAALNAIHDQAKSLDRVLDDPSLVERKIAEWKRFLTLILPDLQTPFQEIHLTKIPSKIGVVSQERAVAHCALQAELYESTDMEAVIHATAQEHGVKMNPDIRLVRLPTTEENASEHHTDRKKSYLVPFLEIHPLNIYGGKTLCTIVDPQKGYPHLPYISFPDFASKAEKIVQKVKQSERAIQKRTHRQRNIQTTTDKSMEYKHELILLTREYGVALGELLYGMSSSALLNNIPNTKLELTEDEQDTMLTLSKKAFKETIAEYLEENGVLATSCENFQSILETMAERSLNYLKTMLQESEENGLYCHGLLQFWVIAGRKFGPFFGHGAHHELMLTLTREHVNTMMSLLINKWFTPCLQRVLPDINPAQQLIALPDIDANPIPTLKALLLPTELWMATRALAKHDMEQTQKSAGAESITPQKTKPEIQQARREEFILGTTTHDELFKLFIDAGYEDLAVAKQSREIRVPGRSPEQWVKRTVDYYKITPDGAALFWSDLCDGTLLKNIYKALSSIHA